MKKNPLKAKRERKVGSAEGVGLLSQGEASGWVVLEKRLKGRRLTQEIRGIAELIQVVK